MEFMSIFVGIFVMAFLAFIAMTTLVVLVFGWYGLIIIAVFVAFFSAIMYNISREDKRLDKELKDFVKSRESKIQQNRDWKDNE